MMFVLGKQFQNFILEIFLSPFVKPTNESDNRAAADERKGDTYNLENLSKARNHEARARQSKVLSTADCTAPHRRHKICGSEGAVNEKPKDYYRVFAPGVPNFRDISERFTSEADAKRLKREILMVYPAATVRIEKTDEMGGQNKAQRWMTVRGTRLSNLD